MLKLNLQNLNKWRNMNLRKLLPEPKNEEILTEKQLILEEIQKAHREWVAAQTRLDWVVEKDQIDYAIYALEAAEKKYEMLLRQAKNLRWNNQPLPLRKEG